METSVALAAQTALSPHASSRSDANAWLIDFQGSSDSWQVCINILSGSGFPIEAQLYASQTLRQKIRYQLHTLNDEDTSGLQSRLLAQLSTGLPLQVLSQLCLATASLLIQCTPALSPVQALAERLPAAAMLQLLIVLPDEACHSRYLNCSRNAAHQQPRSRVAAWSDEVVSWLWAGLQLQHDPGQARPYYEAFTAWAALGCLAGYASNGSCLAMIISTFQSLQSQSASGDLLAVLVAATEAVFEHSPEELSPHLCSLCAALPSKAFEMLGRGSQEGFEACCRTYSAFCSCFPPLWASDAPEGRHLREGLFSLATAQPYPDNLAVDRPLTASALEAWALLADHLSDSRVHSQEYRWEIAHLSSNFVGAMLQILSTHPASQLAAASEEGDELPFYAANTLKETARVTGTQRYIRKINNCALAGNCSFQAALFAGLAAAESFEDKVPCDVESAELLFALFRAAGGHLLKDQKEQSAMLLLLVKAVSHTVHFTARQLHSGDTAVSSEDVLEFAMSLAISSLQAVDLRLEASKLSQNAAVVASDLAVPLPVEALRWLLDSCGDDPISSLEADEHLVKAIAIILERSATTREQLNDAIQQLVGRLPDSLSSLTAGAPDARRSNQMRSATALLTRLDIILSTAKGKAESGALAAVAARLFAEVWPLLSKALLLPSANPLLEQTAACVKSCMGALLPSALGTIVSCLMATPALLDLEGGHAFCGCIALALQAFPQETKNGKVATIEGPQRTLAQAVNKALVGIGSSRSVNQLMSGFGAGDEFPQAAEALLDLMCHVCWSMEGSSTTEMIAVSGLLQQGVSVSAACMACQSRDVASAALSSMATLIERSWLDSGNGNHDLMRSICNKGQHIMLALLMCLIGPSPLARVQKVTCLVGCMAILPISSTEAAVQWLGSALHQLPPGTLLAGEGQAVLESWGGLLRSGASSGPPVSVSAYARSIAGRRLKKEIRAFAERHSGMFC